MHVHLDVLRAVPLDATVTPVACSELEQLRATLQPGRLYVLDRGYAGYWLLRVILDAGSSFVMRLKDNMAYAAVEERPLTEAARAAGVVRDVTARRLGTDRHRWQIELFFRRLKCILGCRHLLSGG